MNTNFVVVKVLLKGSSQQFVKLSQQFVKLKRITFRAVFVFVHLNWPVLHSVRCVYFHTLCVFCAFELVKMHFGQGMAKGTV